MNMDFLSLEDLMEHFVQKTSMLKLSLSLRNLNRSQSNVLCEVNRILPDLKRTLNEMNEMIKIENEKIEYNELQKSKLQELNERLNYIKENVPTEISSKNLKLRNDKERNQGLKRKPKQSSKMKNARMITEIEYLTEDEFTAVPKYMKGRLSCSAINDIINGFNTAISAKYKLLSTPRHQLGLKEIRKYSNFLNQETSETKSKGIHFCLDEDLKHFGNVAINKSLVSILVILRHCNRIYDIRDRGIVRHAIV